MSNRRLLVRWFQDGFRDSDLLALFTTLPPVLHRAVGLATSSTFLSVQASWIQSGLLDEAEAATDGGMAARPWLAPDVPWQQAGDSDGVVRITFDPMSLATTEYYCNGSFARMAGLTVGHVRPPSRCNQSPSLSLQSHPCFLCLRGACRPQSEELVSRVAANDMPLPLCPLDATLLMLDYIRSWFELESTHCFRWRWPGVRPPRPSLPLPQRPLTLSVFGRQGPRAGAVHDHQGVRRPGPVLAGGHTPSKVRLDAHIRSQHFGLLFPRILFTDHWFVRPPQELRSYRELTAAEFDALQASAPAIRDGCLRQLRAAMGDTRGGRQLLEEWEADRWALTETE